MGILSTSLLDGKNLPIPLYLPNQSYVRDQQDRAKKNLTQVQAAKFAPVSLPSGTGQAPVPASLFYTPENAGRYGLIPGDDASQGVSAVFFDLIKSENHRFKSNVSFHPVENDSEISDHIQKEPREGSFVAMVSNFSLLRAGQPLENTALAAFQMLKQIWMDEKTVELVLVMDTYGDVAITDISAPRSADSGDALEFDISFAQVQKVALKEISIRATVHPPSMTTTLARKASVNMKGGDVGGTEVSELSEIGEDTDPELIEGLYQ